MSELNINSITFGKYKNKCVDELLKDRKYCKWLIDQEFFKNYEYLYNKVIEYNPQKLFIKDTIDDRECFIEKYKFFNLLDLYELKIELKESEKLCYNFYIKSINELKEKILNRLIKEDDNPYDIKAPTKWLQKFETETGLTRNDFKDFINTYELPNIVNIVEDIKKEGGIEYKGAKSFLIAKKNSESQEKFWELLLKNKYGEYIGTQFKYENCIFDFINIPDNIIYECKLGLKDFNEDQYNKYLLALKQYKIFYLISNDCIINTDDKKIYTTDIRKYFLYQTNIPLLSKPSKFDEIILEYDLVFIDDIEKKL
jgi:hypothetical protein